MARSGAVLGFWTKERAAMVVSRVLLLSVLLAAISNCQEPLTLHTDTTLVLIPVGVTDKLNRFVVGLDKGNFKLLEDGKEQKISVFSGEDAPLSIGILVDTSGSMDIKLNRSRQAAREFLKTMNQQDEGFLLEFNDSVEMIHPFTNNFNEIDDNLDKLQSKGLTALFDALHTALKEMKRAKNPRKALLLISDGGENHSRYTAADISGIVREADVQIYAIGVFEPTLSFGRTKEEKSGPELLAEITDQTGGRAFPARSLADLPALAAKVGIELRNQYVLGYSPANHERDGSYRKVQVKLLSPPGLPDLKAAWRLGYYAPVQ
jgi:Ca-activated chloride channel homolog